MASILLAVSQANTHALAAKSSPLEHTGWIPVSAFYHSTVMKDFAIETWQRRLPLNTCDGVYH
eukprot:718402-Pelagomonas_calceolata.AAC.3